jgi:hypothetical protein
MNIIFGRENADVMSKKYTVLELDTVKLMPAGTSITAFCAVENIPIVDMPRVDSMKSLHENLLINYRKKDWNYCQQALEHLTGFWGHDLDTFYHDIGQRIAAYMETDPGPEWDGAIQKSVPHPD